MDKEKIPLKLISLLIAMLLFLSVNQNFTNFFVQADESNFTTSWVRDVPVEVNYDRDKYYILGVPDSVDVKLTGLPAKVQKEVVDRKFKVRLDFSNVSVGNDQKIKVDIVDLDSSLRAISDPEFITVSVRDRVAREFDIIPTVQSERLLLGYTIKSKKLADSRVVISGAAESINNIYEVRAESDTKTKISSDTSEEVRLVAYDRNFNKIEDVDMDKLTTIMTLEVESVVKTMAVQVNQIGSLPEGYTLESIQVEPVSIIVRSDTKEDLATINEVFVDVELSGITSESTVLSNLKVYTDATVPNSIESSTVKVTIKTKKG